MISFVNFENEKVDLEEKNCVHTQLFIFPIAVKRRVRGSPNRPTFLYHNFRYWYLFSSWICMQYVSLDVKQQTDQYTTYIT